MNGAGASTIHDHNYVAEAADIADVEAQILSEIAADYQQDETALVREDWIGWGGANGELFP